MGTRVKPPTIHYLVTKLRHERGVLAAEQKWVESPSFSREEALKVIEYRRKILDAYERSLSGLAVDD